MNQYVGIEQSDSLGRGGEQLGQEADGIRTQLNQLIQDMTNDADSLKGDALNRFRQARGELTQRFDELMAWCANNGVKLNEGQQQFNVTDADSSDDFGQAGAQASYLSRNPNG